MSEVLARTWKLLWNTVAIGKLQSVSLTLDRETIDITSYDSNQWKDIDVGDKNWSIEIEANFDEAVTEGFEQIYDDFDSGTTGTALLSTQVSGTTTFAGSAKVTSVPLQGSKGEILKFNATFSGTGALTKGTVA